MRGFDEIWCLARIPTVKIRDICLFLSGSKRLGERLPEGSGKCIRRSSKDLRMGFVGKLAQPIGPEDLAQHDVTRASFEKNSGSRMSHLL